MVKTVPYYDPPREFSEGESSLIHFDLRVMTRDGEVLIDFGEFEYLLTYNDSLNVESPAGSFTLKMRHTLRNEEILKRIHPGLVVEIYAARNDDPLKNVGPFIPQTPEENPEVFQVTGDSLLSEPFRSVEGEPAPPPEPGEPDYLDLAPYLLLRGVTTAYGRSSSVVSGSGAETSLTLSGESYGKVYRDASILIDRSAPTALGKELQTRLDTQQVHTVVPLYYGILRHWVEEFWGEPTGWQARTRPIPVPPDVMARVNEGAVWSTLQYLSVQGIFHLFVDHTGALVWEKLPWSGKCQTLIDQVMTWSDHQFRNWEDLPLVDIPSSWIISWADRLSCDRMANYVRCQMTQYGGSGGSQANMDAGQVYNMGSIRQYGGPKKMEILLPSGTAPTFPFQDGDRQEGEKRLRTVMDLISLEAIRWYDRPVQRVILQVRGDSGWRIHTRGRLAEDWHYPEAEQTEYYILSRAHSINLQQGSWTTQLEMLRDRRTRYLGIGNKPVQPEEMGTALDGIVVPIEPDEYWFFDREQPELGIVKLDDYETFVRPYRDPECLLPEESEASAEEPAEAPTEPEALQLA